MLEKSHKQLITVLGVVLCLYTLGAVNYNVLQPQSALALFMLLGMVLCFLVYPAAASFKYPDFKRTPETESRWRRQHAVWLADRMVGYLLAAAAVVCFGYVFINTEPVFRPLWPGGVSLGDRASDETLTDVIVGGVGLLLVLEGTRRSIGWIVPALALAFVLHSYYAASLPDWMMPHRGQNTTQIVSSTFLQSLGVLGPAASVMFKYVFLFVVFGSLLEMSGATRFIIDFAERMFGGFRGGPALVSVIGSLLMGSLSGSAVANAVTTGSFTIPTMRNSGFKPHVAGGITAAAASGGALVPPVMGAGAYMMLEFIERPAGEPPITFMEIVRAAAIPALLYYFSLLAIVFLYARRAGASELTVARQERRPLSKLEGVLFFGALALLVYLLIDFSPFKAVSGSLVFIMVLSAFQPKLDLGASLRMTAVVGFAVLFLLHQASAFFVDAAPAWIQPLMGVRWALPEGANLQLLPESLLGSAIFAMFGVIALGLIHPRWRPHMVKALSRSSKNGISLVSASACVGIIIGIVQTTPVANEFGEVIKGIVETNLFLALLGIMVCSLVLGMGVPSVVCYLLMATLMGSLLSEMGVEPLAAHLFIFYFGMMSMVTPPVALAAYASASIAEAKIMPTAFAAFRFALVGFTLPFMFIYRPALLLMNDDGRALITWELIEKGIMQGETQQLGYAVSMLLLALVTSGIGIVALAICLTGQFKNRVGWPERCLYFVSAALLLSPHLGGRFIGFFVNLAGALLFVALVVFNLQFGRAANPQPAETELLKPGAAPTPSPAAAKVEEA